MRRILDDGVIAGLIVGIPAILLAVALGDAYPSGAPGMVIGYTTMLAALSIIFHAIKRRRDVVNGGVIKFLPAFLMRLGISAVAGVLYVPAREATRAISSMDFLQRTIIGEWKGGIGRGECRTDGHGSVGMNK